MSRLKGTYYVVIDNDLRHYAEEDKGGYNQVIGIFDNFTEAVGAAYQFIMEKHNAYDTLDPASCTSLIPTENENDYFIDYTYGFEFNSDNSDDYKKLKGFLIIYQYTED